VLFPIFGWSFFIVAVAEYIGIVDLMSIWIYPDLFVLMGISQKLADRRYGQNEMPNVE